MLRIIWRVLAILAGILVTVIVLFSVSLPFLIRRSFPKLEGTIQLAGLDGPVDIYRDSYGVPQIYAATQHDLFFAQGYVHAQDRFWQMDFWRHQGGGRLSELLGKNTIETDRYLSTLGWERVARQEILEVDKSSLSVLESYAEGVNAYLDDHKGSYISLEYVFLNLLNPGYEPEPWEPLHTYTWAKAMAWDLRGNMDTELDQARLLMSLSPDQLGTLYPEYNNERPVIVNYPHIISDAPPSTGSQIVQSGLGQLFRNAETQLARVEALPRDSNAGIGSNSWALSGELTDSGMPYLANDPHLGPQLPSIWYEVGLHCIEKNESCPYDVVGFSFAGAPGVIIGHNDRIAWGLTNIGPDVMDLYIEKINPENPNQYEVNGEWVDMDLVTEIIHVAGGDPIEMTVRLTRHGPIISDVSLDDFESEAALEFPEPFAIALRWTALEPSQTFRATWKMNRAQNWDDFQEAAMDFRVPAQNLLYADVDGNIGYQTPGNIPIRKGGHSGMVPVPGWTDEYEWQGYIPFEEMPFALNPPEGYIVTANNAVIGPDYPYTISREWAQGFRAQSILDLLKNAPEPFDIAYIQKMQASNRNMIAERLIPVLVDIPMDDAALSEMQVALAGWDFQNDMESTEAAIFAAFWKQLLADTFHDEFPEDFWPDGSGRWREVIWRMADDVENEWWDDKTTSAVENRDEIFVRSLTAAIQELEETLGQDKEAWKWGDLHTLTFNESVMSNFPLINKLFDRGPVRTSGGEAVLNATGWDASESFAVNWVPSMRMIVDLGNLENSLTMHLTGQSGHVYHENYIDMLDPWRKLEYHPMYWGIDMVEGAASNHLRLEP